MDEYVGFISNEEFGIADVRGAWIYGKEDGPLSEQKFQGREKLKTYLTENPEVLEKCKHIIVEKFTQNLASDPTDEEEAEESSPDDWGKFQ
ncbi:MAG: hypothetical protein LC650_01135 [Actinobacteria bacterium]|nr:hypothetical protein [Actinomycetota bacterium]